MNANVNERAYAEPSSANADAKPRSNARPCTGGGR